MMESLLIVFISARQTLLIELQCPLIQSDSEVNNIKCNFCYFIVRLKKPRAPAHVGSQKFPLYFCKETLSGAGCAE